MVYFAEIGERFASVAHYVFVGSTLYLNQQVWSMINRAPAELIQEILLVDDASSVSWYASLCDMFSCSFAPTTEVLLRHVLSTSPCRDHEGSALISMTMSQSIGQM